MDQLQEELVAWLAAGFMGLVGVGSSVVAWFLRTFLFDRVKKLEDELKNVKDDSTAALAVAVNGLRIEVAHTGESLRKEISATRLEIKQDVAMYLEALKKHSS
jgi:uncharacterized protein (UPF0335 family)